VRETAPEDGSACAGARPVWQLGAAIESRARRLLSSDRWGPSHARVLRPHCPAWTWPRHGVIGRPDAPGLCAIALGRRCRWGAHLQHYNKTASFWRSTEVSHFYHLLVALCRRLIVAIHDQHPACRRGLTCSYGPILAAQVISCGPGGVLSCFACPECSTVRDVTIGDINTLTNPARFFLEPGSPRQRQYEALRAFFVEGRPSADVAKAFGYTSGAFRVLCHQFRHDPDKRQFFQPPSVGRPPGARSQDRVRAEVVALRKKNYSVQDISRTFSERGEKLTPAAARDILREEGFAPLPRRLDEERPESIGPAVQPYADVRQFSLGTREFTTDCGGLFLFVPDLVRLNVPQIADVAGLPGSKPIPAAHALLSALALKLWSIERKSHVMALAADEGLALFSGLNTTPKKSFLSEYSHRLERRHTLRVLGAWQDALAGEQLVPGESINLDFHSLPYAGEHPVVQKHYVAMRSRRQPSILAFMAQDADSNVFCYANADLRKGEEAEEVFRFIDFWKEHHEGRLPAELVFDSKLTTQKGLARLDAMGIPFITLRRRDKRLLDDAAALPASAWRTVSLDNVTRKFRTPRVFEQSVTIERRQLRQLFIEDLGHEETTILLTNQQTKPAKRLITRYAHRMLIENALSDAVRFFHMNALSSAVAFKVDFDLALLVIASGLYRLLARRMRGYSDAQARQIFRDLVDMPATVRVSAEQVRVTFLRRAHLPILLASELFSASAIVPWWGNARLVFSAGPG
jgi:hypothetical protein